METTSAEIECRRFERPDETFDFGGHGRIEIITMHDGASAMHAILQPGWQWSVDEKPWLGDPETCPLAHTGYCIAGEIVVRIVNTGEERIIRQGDFFEIPPGHDAYVSGERTCELIMFAAAYS